jgi:oxygen-independent coproporphyrinogen-3 oxidase
MYEEETPLHRALQRGDFEELSEEENVEQFQMLIKKMKEAGYRHYEISNFAMPGYESRHNSSYWNDTTYIGCGAAAHSYNGESREWNITDIKEYIKGIESGKRNYEIELLSEEERYNDTILTRLRTADGIPLKWIKEKFCDKLNSYMLVAAQSHIECGNLKKDDESLSLTEKGIFISDAVIRDLIYAE